MYVAIDEKARDSGTGLIKKDKYTYICKGDKHSLADLWINQSLIEKEMTVDIRTLPFNI